MRKTNESPVKQTIGPLKGTNNDLISEDQEIAEILNTYFCSVFTEEINEEIPQPHIFLEDQNKFLSAILISEEDVTQAIDKLKVNKSPGPESIYPRVLKECKNNLVKPLVYIFNKSLETGEIPNEFKLANVTPIFKKGDKSEPGNYRPISLTSVVGKLLESILRDKIVEHLENNELIRDSQHGFRRKRSCLTNLLDFFHDIFNIYDDCKELDILYFDFQKAFDKVPHRRLLSKIKAHGIEGSVLIWIESWLKDRKQRVVVNGKTSSWRAVTSGVPQGSVLGPVLFALYINDIDLDIKNIVSKFADDTKIGGKARTQVDRESIQHDIDKVKEWSDVWLMPFNVDKCKALHVGRNNIKHNYIMRDEILKSVTEERDLGVIISEDLKCSKHCLEIVKKANKVLGLIGRLFEFKTKQGFLTLYNALVRPILEYGVQFWSPHLRQDIDRLERVQRRATKMIPSLRNKSYEERLRILNLFPLERRRMRGDMIQVFKMVKRIDNVDPNKYFTFDNSNVTRNNGFKIIKKQVKSNEAKFFFFNRIVNVWNGLPRDVVQKDSVDSFKKALDKYFEANPETKYYPDS